MKHTLVQHYTHELDFCLESAQTFCNFNLLVRPITPKNLMDNVQL